MLLLRQEFPDKAKRKVIAVQFNPLFLNNLTLQERLEYRYSMLLSKKKAEAPSVSACMHQNGWTEKNLEANYKLNVKQQKVSWVRVGLRH